MSKDNVTPRVKAEHAPITWTGKLFVVLARLLFGATFIFSGFVKAVDPVGTAIKFEEYFNAFGLTFLVPLSFTAALLLAAIEFTLGVAVFCGSYRRFTVWTGILFMSVMTPLTLYLAIANPVKDCGCFGDALILSNWETFYKNIILLLLILFLKKKNTQVIPLFDHRVQWITILFTLLYSLTLSTISESFEPVVDFRPFKIGVNINEARSIPEGEKGITYETTLVYEKNGEKKEFTLENYPEGDSTWQFVETINKEIAGGYKPTIEHFDLYNAMGENITDSLLTHTNTPYDIWIIIPSIKYADNKEIDKINELYEYAIDHNYSFVAITDESSEEVTAWRDISGAEYPFLFADKTILQTIMRSNPGIVILKEGTILAKENPRALPRDIVEMAPLDQNELKFMHQTGNKKHLIQWSLILLIPLLTLLFTEKTVVMLVRKFIKTKTKINNNQQQEEK